MSLTTGRLVQRSAWYHRGIAFAVTLGVAAATAVVSGALLVGDSMRGSLRDLTLQRLGAIDAAVMPGTFFNATDLAEPLQPDARTVPVIYFSRAAIETNPAPDQPVRRSGNVQVMATTAEFWSFETSDRVKPLESPPQGNSVVLNARAADELGVAVGDLVTVRLPAEQAVPADSPLGRRDSESEGLPRLTVSAIIPNEGLGRFEPYPSQNVPLNCYLPIELARQVLERPDQANLLLVDLPDSVQSSSMTKEQLQQWTDKLKPSLSDFGIQLHRVTRNFGEPAEPVFDYYSVTSERLLLTDGLVAAIKEATGQTSATPVLTYLANAIESMDGQRSVPYSTISAIDSTPALPLNYSFPLSTDEPSTSAVDSDVSENQQRVPIVLNSWAAEQLQVKVDDPVRVFYFEPETTEGREVERDFIAVVSEIVPIVQPERPYRRGRDAVFAQRPTVYNDPDLTPTVPGVTDQDSISDWDLPFELDRTINAADDDYWSYYRLTPKAFIPLDQGQRLFGSRFGDVSGLRIPTSLPEAELQASILSQLRIQQAELGFSLQPLKADQLAASRGTTPFDALFLSLSFLVIVAALMLVALLFRLGLEQRAAEYGVLMAVGFPGKQVSRMALTEGTLISVPGAIVGTVLGVLYALGVIWALGSWWVGAVTVPFLQFHWSWLSLGGGCLAGILMTALTIMITARRLRRAEVRPLLGGRIPERNDGTLAGQVKRGSWLAWIGIASVATAIGLGAFAVGLSGPAQAGAFVGGGMLLLCGLLILSYVRLSAWRATEKRGNHKAGYSLWMLALRGLGRNPLRSTLSIGLMAVACFLIVSMSAFQMRPSDSGVGGFDLLGRTAVPLYKDLSDPVNQKELFGDDANIISSAKIIGLRYRPGQDASCNNLYQATSPQVLGVPTKLADWYSNDASNAASRDQYKGGPAPISFDWAATDRETMSAKSMSTPWDLLAISAQGTQEDPVPVILDQNTAMWSLQMRGGVGEVRGFRFDDGGERYFKVVALLSNSVMQGSLLVGEANFERLFPAINGYSYFMIQARPGRDLEKLAGTLESKLGDVGMDTVDSRQILSGLMAVQNTYLRTFQSLGALGLLLGAFGLAVVQLRNVLERRSEFALLSAVGFSRGRLISTVLIENAALLLGGIAFGAGAAMAAIVPYMLASGTEPAVLQPIGMLAIVVVAGLLAGVTSILRVASLPIARNL